MQSIQKQACFEVWQIIDVQYWGEFQASKEA
jgi:hypothetical protein